ncbi:hypothetical protein EBU60_06015, partial [bacterium]|nr:hypothetical protein [bacterium]
MIGTGAGTVTKAGTGTWTLSGASTYTGVTTISGGTLSVATIENGGIAGNLGQATNLAANLVLGGGTLKYTGATASTDRAFTITNLTTGTFEVTTSGTDLTITGAAASTSGALTKTGTGRLILSGANAYTGLTTITAGALRAGNATALGTTAGGVTVESGAALELYNYIAIGAEALTLNNDGIGSAGALRNISGTNIYAGAITLSTNAVRISSDTGSTLTLSGGITNGGIALTIGGVGNTTISTAAIAGAGTLTKDGSGTLTLSVANTYTGLTTVSAGSLTYGI